jgi:hypothetical protein
MDAMDMMDGVDTDGAAPGYVLPSVGLPCGCGLPVWTPWTLRGPLRGWFGVPGCLAAAWPVVGRERIRICSIGLIPGPVPDGP